VQSAISNKKNVPATTDVIDRKNTFGCLFIVSCRENNTFRLEGSNKNNTLIMTYFCFVNSVTSVNVTDSFQ